MPQTVVHVDTPLVRVRIVLNLDLSFAASNRSPRVSDLARVAVELNPIRFECSIDKRLCLISALHIATIEIPKHTATATSKKKSDARNDIDPVGIHTLTIRLPRNSEQRLGIIYVFGTTLSDAAATSDAVECSSWPLAAHPRTANPIIPMRMKGNATCAHHVGGVTPEVATASGTPPKADMIPAIVTSKLLFFIYFSP